MSAPEFSQLVTNAKGGQPEAVTKFILAIARDLRAFIGTFAASPKMLEEVHANTWMQVRREINTCPPSSQVVTWIRQRAMVVLKYHLENERNQAISAKDGLRHLIAQDGLESLQALLSPTNDGATHIHSQYPQLDETAQFLIHRRYNEKASLDELASDMQLKGPAEIAIKLFVARATLHWRSSKEDKKSPDDRLLPIAIEQHMAGTIANEARQELSQSLLKDLSRAASFTRQMRVDILLRAIFGDYSEKDALALAANMGKIENKRRNESSLLHVAPPARTPIGSGSEIYRAQERIANRQNSSSSSIRTGSGPRPHASRRRSKTGSDERQTDLYQRRSGRRKMPPTVLIAGCVIVVGIITLFIVWSGGGSSGSAHNAQTTHAGKVAAVLGFEQGYTILDGQKEIAGTLGAEIKAGMGVRSGKGTTTIDLSNISRLVLNPQTEIRSFDQAVDGTGQANIDKGTINIQSMASPGIEIRTPQVRVNFGVARGTVAVDSDRTVVQATSGPVTVTNRDGTGTITIPAGASATALTGSTPKLIQARAFVRGINFGGNNVTIDSQKWFSHRQALTAGMHLAPGTDIASIGALSGVGLDFDKKSMLDTGLYGNRAPIEINQTMPNGEFDITLWIGNTTPTTNQALSVFINDKKIDLTDLYLPRSGWAQLGPITTQIANKKLQLRVDGLGTSRLSGCLLEAPKDAGMFLPPAIAIISPTDAATFYTSEPFDIIADVVGDVTKVAFYAEDKLVGESKSAPYRTTVKGLEIGDHKLTAHAYYGKDQRSISLPLGISIIEAFGSGSITFQMWDNLRGVKLSEANDSERVKGKPKDTFTANKFESKINWGENLFVKARGYIHPPITGEYKFWMTCDDTGELWLSTDENASNIKKIAGVDRNTNGVHAWTTYKFQQSKPITLMQGQRYYIELRYKEEGVDDYGAVGWQLPNGVLDRPINGAHLSPAE